MCGLFSYNGNRNDNKFSWDKFNHLGLDNDERGGDSIGRVVGDEVCKFVSKKLKTTYQEYVINHKNGEPHHLALGHTRKASVGVISEDTAQPIIINLGEGQGNFTMVHNGTLFNYEELATKYTIDKNGKTDSMILAEIIAWNGFDVLLEYQGGAAIIIKDDREPDTIKLFKGCSKTYANKLEEERPLYYYQEDENSMYISSREEGLYFIGGDVDTVFDFVPNILYTIKDGEISDQVIYDRSECSQVKVWPTTVPKYHSGNNFNTKFNAYDGEEDYEAQITSYYESNYHKKSYKTPSIKNDLITNPKNVNQIVCARLRYYFFMDGEKPIYANGVIILNEDGVKNNGTLCPGEKVYYFYCGIMLRNKVAYDNVKTIFGRAKYFIDSETNIKNISEYTDYPICTLDCAYPTYENARKWDDRVNLGDKAPWFYGYVNLLFSAKTYKFSAGSLDSISFNVNITKAVHSNPIIPIKTNTILMIPTVRVSGFTPNPESKLLAIENHSVNCTCKQCYDDIRGRFKDDPFYATPDSNQESIEFLDSEDIEEIEIEDETIDCLLDSAINDGLQAILLAIDACRGDIEVSGFTNKTAEVAVNNFLKLEDMLLEPSKFKTHSLITDYERF